MPFLALAKNTTTYLYAHVVKMLIYRMNTIMYYICIATYHNVSRHPITVSQCVSEDSVILWLHLHNNILYLKKQFIPS